MEIIEGDLFKKENNYQAIFHQCNCFCTMGAGFAKQIAIYYPQAKQIDKNTIIGDKNKLGTFSKAIIPQKMAMPRLVYNLYSQYYYGKNSCQTDYKFLKLAFELACDDLIRFYDYYGKCHKCIFNAPIVIAIPYLIGCGLAGGDEKIVIGIIDEIVKKRNSKIRVKAFRKPKNEFIC